MHDNKSTNEIKEPFYVEAFSNCTELNMNMQSAAEQTPPTVLWRAIQFWIIFYSRYILSAKSIQPTQKGISQNI